jgi:hypothetical protein
MGQYYQKGMCGGEKRKEKTVALRVFSETLRKRCHPHPHFADEKSDMKKVSYQD